MIACSLNEITTQTTKAAKAAGFSWGQADDIGFAVRRLCEFRLPGVEMVAAYLQSRLNGGKYSRPRIETADDWHAEPNKPLCPLACGILFIDLYSGGDNPALHITRVAHPLLFLPFVQIAAQRSGLILDFKWRDGQVVCDCETIRLSPAFAVEQVESVDLAIRTVSTGETPAGLAARERASSSTAVDNKVWRTLAGIAARTYVPASEASRLSGAGAGLVDND